VVRAVQAVKHNALTVGAHWLLVALACGSVFAVNKLMEFFCHGAGGH